MSVSTDTERIFRIGGYVKRAKLNLRNEREIRAFHRNAIERRLGDFEDGTLVDVYIDITGYHYYAIGYSEKHRKLGTFRVDRMKEVEILSADAAAKPADFNLPEFTRRVFDMYDGETKKVTLVCKNDLMNYIVDRFGDEVDTVPGDCGHFRAVAEVSVSQTFFAWVFQFNGDIRITAPEEVVLQYGEMLKNALQT